MSVSVNLSEIGLSANIPFINHNSRSFRPPSWPPPRDWVCIEDKYGNPVSRWGDPHWNFSPWTGKTTRFNFGDGPRFKINSPKIDSINADILRTLVTWRGWGSRSAPTISTLLSSFAKPLRKIVQICSDNNIVVSDLKRYPNIIEIVAKSIPPAKFNNIVAELDRLRDSKDFLGFEILDEQGIYLLKNFQPNHNKRPTEYIPPRIWEYVVNRVSECIFDFIKHQKNIEECFKFCIEAYELNSVSYLGKYEKSAKNPFTSHLPPNAGKRTGAIFHGHFSETAERFGIKELIAKWVGKIDGKHNIGCFTSYLQLVRYAALIDICAFTLMRIDEAAKIRMNCLVWHDDDTYGNIPLIQSETTKTDPDDNGLWITSPGVKYSIEALQSLAKMRMSCPKAKIKESNYFLITPLYEPWSVSRKSSKEHDVRPHIYGLNQLKIKFPKFLDVQQLIIAEQDFKIAKSICPTINHEKFKVGKRWELAWHQFRRTAAVNMFSSGEISDASIQLQMKHLNVNQTLYYGRGHSALNLNNQARTILINTHYEVMGRQLAEVITDKYVSPYGDAHKAKLLNIKCNSDIVNLISIDDVRKYSKAARNHQMNFRQTSLGGCMKNGHCDGDSISSVGNCASGAQEESPCVNVLFDRTRVHSNQKRLDGIVNQLKSTAFDTPLYYFLEKEKRGLENYFVHIGKIG